MMELIWGESATMKLPNKGINRLIVARADLQTLDFLEICGHFVIIMEICGNF